MIDIENLENKFTTKKQNDAIRNFVGSIVVDRGLLKNKNKLFYNAVDTATADNYRVLSEKHFKMYKNEEYRLIQFKPDRGVIKEFFDNKPFTIELPVCPASGNKDVHKDVLYYFLGPLAKDGIIDDLLYSIVRNICTIMGVNYNTKTGVVGFGITQKKTVAKAFGKLVQYKAKDFTLEEVLLTEIEQGFISKEVGDPNRDYGYTHLLRQYSEFKLFEWSKRVLINWNRYNVLATSRGYGKTMLLAFIASRGLLDPRPGFGGRKYREIKLFVPDKENIGLQVMEYIKSMLGDMGSIKLENKKKAFEISKFSIKCNITGNIFKLVSLYNFERGGSLGTSLGEGLACDLALIDEAPRIANAFWVSFHQRAAFETSEFFLTGTINKETPADHWFYKLLIDGEVGAKNISSYRLTIDENEVMQFGKTQEQRLEAVETVKAQLRLGGEKELYAKGYCIILEESNVFNLAGSICSYQPNKYQDTDIRVMGFDFGKLDDSAAIVLINLTHREIEESRLLKNATYGTQLEYAADYKKKYKNILIIGDRSGVGEAVAEQDRNGVVDTWIKSTGQGGLNYNKKHRYYTCSKGVIINNTASVLNNGIIKIPSIHSELLEQFNDFIKMKSGRGEVILYKGKGKKKDDLVLSTAYAVLYMYSILEMKTIEDISTYCKHACKYDTLGYNDVEDDNGTGYYNGLY